MLRRVKILLFVEVALFFLCANWLYRSEKSKDERAVETAELHNSLNVEEMSGLRQVVESLMSNRKGILAADESTGTIGKRFELINLENTEENRRRYRQMLFTTEGIEKFISGVILYKETLRQKADQGTKFIDLLKGINVTIGIKLDEGLIPLGNSKEKISQGIENLEGKVVAYRSEGVKFAKWRSVFEISSTTPSKNALDENAKVLAKYAKICQKNGLVPIIEPEVLATGDHSITEAQRVTERVLAHVYKALSDYNVYLEGTVLKPNMVTQGFLCKKKASNNEIARATVEALRRTVPAAVPGITFLSGGQTELEATQRLESITHANLVKPWNLSFSFGRALQTSALKAWNGTNVEAGQKAFFERAKANSEVLA